MDLRSAITRASRFVAPAKEDNILCGIRFMPAVFSFEDEIKFVEGKNGEQIPLPTKPAYLTASDGDAGIVILLDPTVLVPDMVIEAGVLKKAITQIPKKELLGIERVNDTTVAVRATTGSFITVQAQVGPLYPPPPKFPERLLPFPSWRSALRVLHAAGDDDKRPDLKNLHITPTMLEATDQDRVARAPAAVPIDRGYLVDKTIFRGWPRGDDHFANIGFHEGIAFVFVDEELRYGRAVGDEDFFHLETLLPPAHHGYSVGVKRLALMNAVKFGTAASPSDVVELFFGKGEVAVCGLQTDGSRASQEVLVAEGATDPVRLLMRGRKFWHSLSVLDEDEVALGYSSPQSPLRLESHGGYVSALWPVIQGDTP